MGQYGRNPVEAARETDRYRPLLCSFEVKVDPLVGFWGLIHSSTLSLTAV